MHTSATANRFSTYFLQPARLLRRYDRAHLRADLIAGITVAVILVPQAIAFALVAELPPVMGLYAAIIGAILGSLWGSSNQSHTGPSNAMSLLVLSALLTTAEPGTTTFVLAAGMLALMAGVLQLVLGVARLGLLIDFVSHSVVVGFSAGAGVLITINQVRPLLGLDFSSHNVFETLMGISGQLLALHGPTTVLGVATIILLVLLARFAPRWPSALISMVVASAAVAVLRLDLQGVNVIGELPRSLPPLAQLPFFDFELIAELSTGALAVGAIGLVETAAISRSISAETGQRLDSNQEFVGQGLANIMSGLFSGYAVAGSFSRSAVNFRAGARTPIAALSSGLFALVAMFTLAPLAAYLPRAALAGVLIVTAYRMVNRAEMRRIWRGSRPDALIMVITLLGTLVLHIEFAVLIGILLSFALYILKTSTPEVRPVLPDEDFKHFSYQPDKAPCPQLSILNISGDLYFGAVNSIESAINSHLEAHPEQRYVLLRMHQVNHIDFSGIHMLEGVLRICRERGGDIYFYRVNEPVYAVMQSTGFCDKLGPEHFFTGENAISYLFYKVLDPAVCIYECPVRAFYECQNLPKHALAVALPAKADKGGLALSRIQSGELWERVRIGEAPLIVDVREPREYKSGHIPSAELRPLLSLLNRDGDLPPDRRIVLVCRSGRRSVRAASALREQGYHDITILDGGMLAWEAAGLLEAVES